MNLEDMTKEELIALVRRLRAQISQRNQDLGALTDRLNQHARDAADGLPEIEPGGNTSPNYPDYY